MKTLQIFRAGSHVDSAGRRLTFSAADVEAIAAAYDPELHEAPIVVGHPAADAPAYGWIGGLAAGGDGALEAEARQVDPDFGEMVAAGRFKKISASFYQPGGASNPRPEGWYLRHVGFLGAQPPAVKGLRPVELADGEDVVTIDFEEPALDDAGRRPAGVPPAPDDAGRRPASEPPAPDPIAARAQAVAAAEAALAEREAALAAAERAFGLSERRARDAAAVETLVAAGRVLPAAAPALASFVGLLDDDGVVAFAEGGEAETPRAFFLRYLGGQPPVVEYDEIARREDRPPERSAQDLAVAANAYVEAQRAAGVTVHIADAVRHVLEKK